MVLKLENGIKIIEPNPNLSNAYIHKADDSLESIQVNIKKEWKDYSLLYNIFLSICNTYEGRIKSEIHSCTVDFVKEYLNDYFNKEINRTY